MREEACGHGGLLTEEEVQVEAVVGHLKHGLAASEAEARGPHERGNGALGQTSQQPSLLPQHAVLAEPLGHDHGRPALARVLVGEAVVARVRREHRLAVGRLALGVELLLHEERVPHGPEAHVGIDLQPEVLPLPQRLRQVARPARAPRLVAVQPQLADLGPEGCGCEHGCAVIVLARAQLVHHAHADPAGSPRIQEEVPQRVRALRVAVAHNAHED
mmetsp:Transcript_12932/g.43748  ORF Transcript_12932/g.43748 Transcript_12932/m.43748 type:complete len:217 (-) Transcript_12932:662-1312(-)